MSVVYTATELYVPKRAVRRPVSYRNVNLSRGSPVNCINVLSRNVVCGENLRVNKLDSCPS